MNDKQQTDKLRRNSETRRQRRRRNEIIKTTLTCLGILLILGGVGSMEINTESLVPGAITSVMGLLVLIIGGLK